MGFITGLHGVVALVLLCSLLFVEEAGVPLPFAPGELTLLVGGLLIATGGLNPYVFVPLAFIACAGGAMVGYSWAQVVGERGLSGLAARLHQQKAMARVLGRIRTAGPLEVGVSRLIPGLRIYTTLVAGALGVRRRDFVIGMLPSTAFWVLLWVVLGAAVGIPVEHFFTRIAGLAIQGAILVVIGLGGYLAIRRAPSGQRESLVHVPVWARTVLAVAVDLGVVASILTGLTAIVRRAAGVGLVASWADAVVVVAAVGALYLFVTRRGAGATVGEALLRTVYLPHRGQRSVADSIKAAVGHGPTDRELQAASELLHALGPVPRLAVVRALLDGPRSAGQVAAAVEITGEEASYHLAALRHAGLVEGGLEAGDPYAIAARFQSWLGQLLRSWVDGAGVGFAGEEPREGQAGLS
ncbi:MAG: VTT domain-containing protein [Candidatus Dormiibacterota bacterium]